MQQDAEELIDMARAVMVQRDRLMVADGMTEVDMGVVALSIRFDRCPPALKLRALVENWSRSRIVQEIY